jgi:hypothetical protein
VDVSAPILSDPNDAVQERVNVHVDAAGLTQRDDAQLAKEDEEYRRKFGFADCGPYSCFTREYVLDD